eukprot:scaffold7388_cov248-Pinguiococcus_pyrenoidosus.AAC.1
MVVQRVVRRAGGGDRGRPVRRALHQEARNQAGWPRDLPAEGPLRRASDAAGDAGHQGQPRGAADAGGGSAGQLPGLQRLSVYRHGQHAPHFSPSPPRGRAPAAPGQGLDEGHQVFHGAALVDELGWPRRHADALAVLQRRAQARARRRRRLRRLQCGSRQRRLAAHGGLRFGGLVLRRPQREARRARRQPLFQ